MNTVDFEEMTTVLEKLLGKIETAGAAEFDDIDGKLEQVRAWHTRTMRQGARMVNLLEKAEVDLHNKKKMVAFGRNL